MASINHVVEHVHHTVSADLNHGVVAVDINSLGGDTKHGGYLLVAMALADEQ